jgi:small subunit ribosomal protein S2
LLHLDTNCDPDVVDLPIPGNDDAIRSIHLFCNEMAAAMNEGKAALADANGEDLEPVSQEETEALIAEAVAEGEKLTLVKERKHNYGSNSTIN